MSHAARNISPIERRDRMRARGVPADRIDAALDEAARVQSRPPEALRLPVPDWAWPKYLYRGAIR